MLKTTLGSLLIDQALPQAMRGRGRVLDKKGLADLFQELTDNHPDQYRDVSKRLSDVGRSIATASGSFSFGLKHLGMANAAKQSLGKLQGEIDGILDDDTLDDDNREKRIVEQVMKYQKPLEDDIYNESKTDKNPLAMQILSGARGNPSNLKSLRGADLMYVDHKDRSIPIPIMRSYSQGLTPAEYFAGTFGARKGVLATKTATQDAGFLAKQLNQVSHRLVTVGEDDDDLEHDHGFRGLPTDLDDYDNEGALLAAPVGGYERNTVLTSKVISDLRARKVNKVVVRSPMVGGPADGVWSRDVGMRERGFLPRRGDYVGLAAAQALSEKLSQGQLCLAKGTLVRMADWSTKPIEEIQAADWVLGADKTGMTFPVRVVRRFDNGERECSHFKFRRPFSQNIAASLVCTADHKILGMRKSWGQKSQTLNGTFRTLPIGTKAPPDRFSAARPDGFLCDGRYTAHPFARILGVWLGDGIRVLHDDGVMVSCFDDSLAESIRENIEPLGLLFTKMAGHPGQYYVGQKKDVAERDATGQFMPGYRNPLKQLIAEWGLMEKYAHQKTLPECVFTWDNASVAELLSGLWVTDGSVYTAEHDKSKPYLSYSSTSKPLLLQLQQLLAWRFGIYTTGPYEYLGDRKRELYQLDIATELNVKRFKEQIRLHGKKRVLFDAIVAQWSVVRSRSAPYGLIRKSETPVGILPTYDIEVEHEDHLFVLDNGVIVSNSAKHGGGVAGADKAVSGFKLIDQLIQVPKTFKGGASHAQVDGRVDSVEPAPQGGSYIGIGGKRHYVGQGYAVNVKPGQDVEAGDVLSDGIPNPSEITKHKGIGEGRRYFVKTMLDAYRGASLGAHRRNIELVARGLINHVRLTDEIDDNIPDDVVPYQSLERNWKPREGSYKATVAGANNKYLEKPVLHYSVGTRIRPSVTKMLSDYGVKDIEVHDEPPPFEPAMIRGMGSLEHDPDWVTKHIGSNLEKGTLKAVHRGASSDPLGTSYASAIVLNPLGFGHEGKTKGWKSDPIKPTTKLPSVLDGLID